MKKFCHAHRARIRARCFSSLGLVLSHRGLAWLAALAVLLGGCASSPAPEDSGVIAAEISGAKAMIGPGWPAGHDDIATTSGEIYLGNLNAQIRELGEQAAATAAARAIIQPRLASLLYQRFQIEGRLADAERALAIMVEADEEARLRPADQLAYARILLGFHDFAAAEQAVDAAEARGIDGKAASEVRSAIDRARGLSREPEPESMRERPADFVAAVQHAAALLDRSELAEASRLLREAQALYADTNPFPLAWIHVQQGIAFLRFGEYEAARTFFAAAHERMPQYFLATEHLAETEGLLGNLARSAELYRQVTAQNDQPAFWHGLAGAERALGNTPAAEAAARRAEAGYASLLERHPLMFADHAVDYFLDTNRPDRALELARMNLDARQDLGARLALAEAAMANGYVAEACMQVSAVRSAGLAPPELALSGSGLADCQSAE